ncbi:MAG: hypothetical protein OJF49_003023 [Ktedonobacterales bacterium]|jgi:hypothetical protein|nr:MAG: hypothetical protein OJF49_003023 [Ktedonobacterales bacterium]
MLKRSSVLLVLVSLLFFAACDAAVTVGKYPTPIPTLNAPQRAQMVVQYCVDDTGSYDRAYLHGANKAVAQSIINSVVPNSQGLTVYATAITHNTFDPTNTLPPFVVQPVAAPPALPALTPTPTPGDSDSFHAGSVRDSVNKANSSVVTAYNQQMQSYLDTLHAAQSQTTSDVQRLISWGPSMDTSATSIWGCLGLATQRLQNQPGTKYLIIASDMQNNTCADCDPINLQGVSVHVIYYQSANAVIAKNNQDYWTPIFTQAGATSVRFDDPQTTQDQMSHPDATLFGGSQP